MNKKTLIAVLIPITVLAGVFLYGQFSIFYSLESSDYNKAYWEQQIEVKGGERTYKEFVKRNSTAPFERQHFSAHIIGEILYQKEGIEGITVCDSNFGFGCFHGLFTLGISEQGDEAIKQLNEKCIEQYGPLGTGCLHGIGHGILEYVGPDQIDKALSLCAHTTQLAPLLGCTSGVFMEYFTPLVVTPEYTRAEPNTFSPNSPFGVCDTVESQYKESCYFELAGWWDAVGVGTYQTMGGFCENALTKSEKESCYLGVGNSLIVSYQYDDEAVKKQCDEMPSSEGGALCRAGASWGLFAEKKDRFKSICEDLSEDLVVYCADKADLTREAREKLNAL